MNQRNKWAPFNSVIHEKKILKELQMEKSKIRKPILSEDMIENLENKILDSFENQTPVEITYYYKEHLLKKSGIITKIDSISKKIVLNQNFVLYFPNIIEICEKTIEK